MSLTTVLVADQPERLDQRAEIGFLDSGRSAPARQAEVCTATGPSDGTPASAAARTSLGQHLVIRSVPMP